MIQELSQALASLDTASTIAKSLLELEEAAKNSGTVVELQRAIMAAQQQVLQGQAEGSKLSAKISALENECLRLKQWDLEKLRYSRQEVGTDVFAYIAKDAAGDFASLPKWCSICFEKAIKSLLQQHIVNPGMMINLVCPNGCPKLVFTHYLPRQGA